MNKRLTRLLPLCGFLILAASALWAQNQPKPKSQKELDALRAWNRVGERPDH